MTASASSVTKASTVGPAPETTAGTPSPAQLCDQGERLGHGGQALLLVQEVLGGTPELLGVSAECRDEQSRATSVRCRVGVRDGRRQQAARHVRAYAVRRHEHDRGDRGVDRGLLGPDLLTGPAADHEPAQQRRRDVVGVPLDAGWPGTTRPRRRRRRRLPPREPRASTMPPTMAADDEPRPRLCGIRLVQARCSPGGETSIAAKVASIERTTRWRSSSGTSPAPSPATCTSSPSATSATRVSASSRAIPRQSNPGPRLALVAGT